MNTRAVQNDRIFERDKHALTDYDVISKTLPTVLSQTVEAKAEYDLRLLAQQLGTNYRSLMYWLRGERHFPAYLLPQICLLLKDYQPLDLLESQAGRVAFKIPDPKHTSEKEFLVISNLIRDIGQALESIADTLADGVVDEHELTTTVPKLETVIQECASVKYLLETMYKDRKKKKR